MKEDLYEELIKRKNNGEKLDWDKVTKEELAELYKHYPDSTIAELYGINQSRVKSKRKKWSIKLDDRIIEDFFDKEENKELLKNLNKTSKERLLKKENINTIAIALTHYIFRNGPVEDMHSEGKLSQRDMKTLNKFMVNRIAGLLETMNKEEWLKLELLLNVYSMYGLSWDKPEADTNEINEIYRIMLIDKRKKK